MASSDFDFQVARDSQLENWICFCLSCEVCFNPIINARNASSAPKHLRAHLSDSNCMQMLGAPFPYFNERGMRTHPWRMRWRPWPAMHWREKDRKSRIKKKIFPHSMKKYTEENRITILGSRTRWRSLGWNFNQRERIAMRGRSARCPLASAARFCPNESCVCASTWSYLIIGLLSWNGRGMLPPHCRSSFSSGARRRP